MKEALTEEAARLGVPFKEALLGVLADWAEDALDLAEARCAKAESDPAKRVPWDQVKAELGL